MSASLALISLVGLSIVTLRAEAATVVVNGVSYHVDTVIARDDGIIGGGSTGTYTAIRLSGLGRTVAVIEQEDHRRIYRNLR
jgi:2-polyprenyl-6-methoxyphenol hydroxylase-like FAD-dependent oxidoreductase